MTVANPSNYWISGNALRITLNANGDADYIQGNTASGAMILCFIKSVAGLGYDAGHNYQRWKLLLSPTYFATKSAKYVYVAIPRAGKKVPQDFAQVVFPSEKLDIYGKNASEQQIGSTDYYYIWLQGIISASEVGGVLQDRVWTAHIQTGTLASDEAYESGGDSTWWRYSSVSDTVTFLKTIAHAVFERLRITTRLIFGNSDDSENYVSGIANNDTSDTSEHDIVTPAYGKEKYLSKLTDDTAQGWITVLAGLRTLEEFIDDDSLQGGGIYQGEDGKAHLATDVARVRDMIQGILRIGDASRQSSTFSDGTTVSSDDITLKVRDAARFDDILIALAGIYTNLIKSDNYNGDGAFDTGFFIGKDKDGNSYAVFDKLFVRMKAIFNELEIRKISYAGGNFVFSHAGSTISGVKSIVKSIAATVAGTVLTLSGPVNVLGNTLNIDGGATVNGKTVTLTSTPVTYAYRCYMRADDGTTATENWWRVNDQARCQTSGVQDSGIYHDFESKFYWRRVLAVGHENVALEEGQETGEYNYIDLSVSDCLTGSDAPQAGDRIVQMGNRTDTDRQGFISLEVEGEYAPSFKVYRGVTSYSLDGKRKICISPKYTELHVNRLVVETEYDAQIVPMERGDWDNIEGRRCYYYDLVQHNGSSWLCIFPESGIGGVKYTTEEPSENSVYWQVYAKKGADGKDGKSFNILGSYDTEEELVAAHPTGSVGDAYIVAGFLYVWDEENEEWHNSGQIKGDTGRGISSVTVSYGKSNSTTSLPTAWVASVDSLDIQAGDYLFTRMVVNYTEEPLHGEPSYSIGYIGRDGTSPVVGDIDNEVVNVALDADGKTMSAGSTEIGVAIYNGQSKVTLNNISVPSVPSGLTVTTDKNNGLIRISWAKGVALAQVNTVTVKPNVIIDGVTYERTLGVTVNGIRPGADGKSATIYDLIVSLSSIKKDADGNPDAVSVSATRQKTVGDRITSDTTDGTITYKVDGGSEKSYTNNTEIATRDISTGIEFIFRVGGKVVDRETIPVVSDGTDGINGRDGVSAAIAVVSDNAISVPADSTGHALTEFTESVSAVALVDGREIGKTQLLVEEQTSGDTYITVERNVLSIMPWVDAVVTGSVVSLPAGTVSGTVLTLPTGDYAAVNGDLMVRVPKGVLLNEHSVKVTVAGKDADGVEYRAVTYFTIQRNITADGYIQEYTEAMSSDDTPPTVATYSDYGWSRDAHTPTQELQDVYVALWTCNANGEKISLVSVSLFSHYGDKGEGGTYKSTCFCRTNKDISSRVPSGGTYDNAVPSDMTVSGETVKWSDGMPNGEARLWSTTARFNADGIVGTWSLPVKVIDNDDTDVEFSDLEDYNPIPEDPSQRDSKHWYDPSRSTGVDWTKMIYRAERKILNGAESAWVITRIKGEKGEKGDKGDNITIDTSKTKTEYAVSAQGTDSSVVTGWKATIPSVPQGQYLWTRVVTFYSDGSSTTSHSVSYNAEDGTPGTSITITSKSVKYAVTNNGTQPADSSFTYNAIPSSLELGQYLWTKTEVVYSDGNSTKAYSVSRLGTDGPQGIQGPNGNTTHFAYAKLKSGQTIPSTGKLTTAMVDRFETTNFSGADVIGTYTDGNTADSTKIGDYTFTEWKGDKGDSITKLSETKVYQLSENGSDIPTGEWVTAKPSPDKGKYVWTRTTITWSTGEPTTLYQAERNPNDGVPGMSVYINLQEIKYHKSATKIADPSTIAESKWGAYPTLSKGDWLYTRTKITYKNDEGQPVGTATISYGESYIGTDGDNGVGISGITEHYKGSSKPTGETLPESGDWGTNPMPGDWNINNRYLWNYEKIAKVDKNGSITYERTIPGVVAIFTKDGVGIDSIVNHYVATSQPSGVTKADPSDGTWTASVQSPTSVKRYLWNYETVNYTEGSPYETTPHIICVYGEKGEKGEKGDPSAYINLSQSAVDIEVDENGKATADFRKEITYSMGASGKTLYIKRVTVTASSHVSVPSYMLSAVKNGIITVSGTTATIVETATVSGTTATLSANYVALPHIVVSVADGVTVTEGNVTVNATAVDTDGNEYTAMSLFNVTRQYYAPALQVVLSQDTMILTQNESTETIDLTGAYTDVALRVGATDITTGLSISVATEHCNVSASGNRVAITAILTYKEGSGATEKTLYYDKGYVDITVTYKGNTYTKRWQFYCNLLGTWKQTVQNDTMTAVAGKLSYKVDGEEVVSIENISEQVHSSSEFNVKVQEKIIDENGNIKTGDGSLYKQTSELITLSVSGKSGTNLVSNSDINRVMTTALTRSVTLVKGRTYTLSMRFGANGHGYGITLSRSTQQVVASSGGTGNILARQTFTASFSGEYSLSMPVDSSITLYWVQVEEGDKFTEHSENLTGALQESGIDITKKKITLDSATVEVSNNGQTAALFEDGKIKADYINVATLIAQQLLTEADSSGIQVKIEKGLMEVYGQKGVANWRFGIDGSGNTILAYYNNSGQKLYDLGPNGISSINNFYESWGEDRTKSVLTKDYNISYGTSGTLNNLVFGSAVFYRNIFSGGHTVTPTYVYGARKTDTGSSVTYYGKDEDPNVTYAANSSVAQAADKKEFWDKEDLSGCTTAAAVNQNIIRAFIAVRVSEDSLTPINFNGMPSSEINRVLTQVKAQYYTPYESYYATLLQTAGIPFVFPTVDTVSQYPLYMRTIVDANNNTFTLLSNNKW